MDFSKGKLYCRELLRGCSEETVMAEQGIEPQELYNAVSFTDMDTARDCLKHFCGSYINYICLSWPMADEHFCPCFGYRPDCPLKRC